MDKNILREKINLLEKDLEFIKRFFIKSPDFEIDEKNWLKIKPLLKKIRRKIYQGRYGKKESFLR